MMTPKSLRILAAVAVGWVEALSAQSASQIEFFEKKIRPVLANNCAACHNTKAATAGLDLSTTDGIRYAVQYGAQAGKLISIEKPEESLLMQVLDYTGRLKMPPTGKLKEDQLEDIRAWIVGGAAVPATTAPTAGPTREGAAPSSSPASGRTHREFTSAEKNFWSFQKISNPDLPTVKDASWVKTPVDRFILSKLEGRGLKPSAPADRATLLRRVTFDLTGVPPSEPELKDFLADRSPNAFEKVVDRLLASPRYGEQWGRHWLDVARYADSTGNDEDHRYPYAFRYRDYVIDSFNKNIPFDQFLREQIAGDLLSPGSLNPRGLVATGFLALGQKALAQHDKPKMMLDVYDEQIDTISKGILGVTLSCARCHDHKFDPLLSRDYYSLVSILSGTRNFGDAKLGDSRLLFRPLSPKEVVAAYDAAKKALANKQDAADDLRDSEVNKYITARVSRVADYMLAARRVYRDKADATEVSRWGDLPLEDLKKWVAFLEPSKEPRPYLAEWETADDASLATVAQAYQKRVEENRARVLAQEERIRQQRRVRRAMPAPPFRREGPDAFFNEVYFRGPLGVAPEDRDKILTQDVRDRVAAMRKEAADLQAKMPPEPELACVVEEGGDGIPVSAGKVLIRGDYNLPGEDAPKGFPLILAGEGQPPIEKGSGRLDLANWLTRPDHPLTARVFVNRVWYWHFGEGLVRTPDNFGRMGEAPTHPELLDFLARRFVESGWSVKALHRMILLSGAYQMSSVSSDSADSADAENRLFSRFPRRRLSVEEVHDAMLAVDGTLDPTMGGTLQTGFGTDSENSSGRLSLRPETIKRREIYIPLRRANLPTLLNLFDFGDATTAASKRQMTTVAPQALFMMNSEFVTERAANLAKALLSDSSLEDAARMRAAYIKVLSREARPQEVDRGLTYVSEFQKRSNGALSAADAWTSLCRILLASNEFIYLD